MIVAGDITADELRPLAEKYYGVIPAGEVAPRLRPQEPPSVAPRRIEYFDARVQQPSLQRSYLVPSYASADDGVAESIDLLGQVLGTGSTSRFYRELVVDRALAASAGAFYSGTALDMGRFVVYATPRPGVELADLEAAMDKVIAKFLSEGANAEELDRAKSNTIADVIYSRDNQRSMAQAFGAALTTGLTVEDVLQYPDRIKAVTIDDVDKAAELVFNNRAQVTAYLKPEPSS